MIDNDTVYVQIGRGCGKTTILYDQLEELMKSGKKVVIIEPKCTPKQPRRIPYANCLTDLDILTPEQMERAEQILKMFLKGKSNA